MSSNNSNDQLNAMIQAAGKKLGIPPSELLAALSNPKKADAMLSQIDKKTGGKISAKGTESLENIIKNNPTAKKMFDNLTRGGKNG
jgi:hypothetical protein